MSTYRSLTITRSRAKAEVLNYLMGDDITDECLREMMDSILRERLYNTRIVPDECDNDDEQL
jgi:hypothetical protein